MHFEKVVLGHGSGGSLTRQLIRDLFLKKFNNPILKQLADSAIINYKEKLAFTTDSFVVSPLWFGGGDIGKLAVCGTVNDLVMVGALPQYLSLALIIEEGLSFRTLQQITDSIAQEAKKAGVLIVAGDTKVVEKDAADKIFINTSGIGRIIKNKPFSIKDIQLGDKVIVTGQIGQHGLAVLAKRSGLDLGFSIPSDCAALNSLLVPILEKTGGIKFMRDPTRGGVAASLNEIAQNLPWGIAIEEKAIPVSEKVKAAAELLGIEPLYIANEGRAIMVVSAECAQRVLGLLRRHPLGKDAAVIGEVTSAAKAQVILKTTFGGERIIDMPVSEPLPRIC